MLNKSSFCMCMGKELLPRHFWLLSRILDFFFFLVHMLRKSRESIFFTEIVWIYGSLARQEGRQRPLENKFFCNKNVSFMTFTPRFFNTYDIGLHYKLYKRCGFLKTLLIGILHRVQYLMHSIWCLKNIAC